MRVSGSSIVSGQLDTQLRPDTTERLQRSTARDNARAQADEAALASFEPRTNRQEGFSRRVSSSSNVSDIVSRNSTQKINDENLPLNARKALKTFAENSQSLEQSLGIELAGIDIRV